MAWINNDCNNVYTNKNFNKDFTFNYNLLKNPDFGFNLYWYYLRINNDYYRCYLKNISNKDVFYTESLCRFFILSKHYKFYLIETSSTKKHVLNTIDIDFLGKNYAFDIGSGKFNVPINIQNLQNEKFKDLNFLSKIEGVKFIYFIPKINLKNQIYYTLILGFENTQKIDLKLIFKKFKSNIVKIKSIIPFNHNFFNLDWIKKNFNTESTIFKNTNLTWWQYDSWTNNEKLLKSEEWKNYNECVESWLKDKNVHNWTEFEKNIYQTKETFLKNSFDDKKEFFKNYELYEEFTFKKLSTQFLCFEKYFENVYNDEHKCFCSNQKQEFLFYYDSLSTDIKSCQNNFMEVNYKAIRDKNIKNRVYWVYEIINIFINGKKFLGNSSELFHCRTYSDVFYDENEELFLFIDYPMLKKNKTFD